MLLIFDLDGTLVNTEPAVRRLTRSILAESGLGIAGDREHLLETYNGLGVPEKFFSIAKECNFNLDDITARNMAAEHERRKKLIYEQGSLQLFPGVKPALGSLEKAGHRLCLASSNPSESSRRALEITGIDSLFGNRVYGSDHAGGRTKPDSGIFQRALNDNGYANATGKCLVIEDSMSGLEAARKLALKTLIFAENPAARRREAFTEAGAAGTFSAYAQLTEIVQSLDTETQPSSRPPEPGG